MFKLTLSVLANPEQRPAPGHLGQPTTDPEAWVARVNLMWEDRVGNYNEQATTIKAPTQTEAFDEAMYFVTSRAIHQPCSNAPVGCGRFADHPGKCGPRAEGEGGY